MAFDDEPKVQALKQIWALNKGKKTLEEMVIILSDYETKKAALEAANGKLSSAAEIAQMVAHYRTKLGA